MTARRLWIIVLKTFTGPTSPTCPFGLSHVPGDGEHVCHTHCSPEGEKSHHFITKATVSASTRWIVVRDVWPINSDAKHLSPRAWADPLSMQDKDGVEKRVCSHAAFLLIPVYAKCFAHLLLAAAAFWLWSTGRYRVMQTGERAFCGRRRQCETPIPTPGAPTPTHPRCSGPSALPAVLGSWRAIFNRALRSVSEEETSESMRPKIKKKSEMRDTFCFVVSLFFN